MDAGAWEKVLHDLARLAGLDIPESRLERFSDHGSTFLVKRFDRTGAQDRIHFASEMTMLGKTDGSSAADGSSYLELVAWIRRNTADPTIDLEELWRRIAFSIAVSNTDDHLRNHGFIFSDSGWSLSPMYDINPDPQGRGLSLNISETDNSLDFNLVLEQAQFFRVSSEKALSYLRKLNEVLENLVPIAASYGLQRREVQAMNHAFRRFGD